MSMPYAIYTTDALWLPVLYRLPSEGSRFTISFVGVISFGWSGRLMLEYLTLPNLAHSLLVDVGQQKDAVNASPRSVKSTHAMLK